jgi:hypothetical protein
MGMEETCPEIDRVQSERQRAENHEAEIFGRCLILRKDEAGSLYVGS